MPGKTCPNCGHVAQSDINYCPKCGMAQGIEVETVDNTDSNKVCPKCGCSNLTESTYCSQCGSGLSQYLLEDENGA